MDWCNSAPQDPKDAYPKMGKALNESGRHIAFNMWYGRRPRASKPTHTFDVDILL
jgi:hypothetical protein